LPQKALSATLLNGIYMTETASVRKNKIILSDYDHRRDIENRLLMAQFTTFDLEVLEEILYSSLQIPIDKLAKNIDAEEADVLPSLEKLSKTGLLAISEEEIVVDKEMRKYYETQIVKFDDNFTPGMDFLQGLLRKVPIHILPTWYSVPRSSNNIFDSLVEKYLMTPQIFQRYLMEIHFGDPNLSAIIQTVYHSPDFKVSSQEIIDKFGFSREQFEEAMLHLEFNFVCCLGYNRIGNEWMEVVTPFHEWREYSIFLKSTEVQPIADPSQVLRKQTQDFAFVQDLTALLNRAKKEPVSITDTPYLAAKLRLLRLAEIKEGKLYALDNADEWLDMRMENRALYIYRHPHNSLLSDHLPIHLCTEKLIRESEKSILRVLNTGWVYYDEFVKGVHVPLGESSAVVLKRTGKSWRYALPEYSDEERALIKATIFEWLFEAGVVAIGTHESRDCFCVTPFGQSLFSR
jgi:hypothetical protein